MNKGDWVIPNQCTAGVQETGGYVYDSNNGIIIMCGMAVV